MNIEDLVFDDEGNCLLKIGESLYVNVSRDERLSRYVLTAPVAGELPEALTYDLLLDLFSYALGPIFDGSPAIGRDPDDGKMIAFSILPFQLADEKEFPEQLERFCAFCMNSMNLFAAVERGDEVVSADGLLSSDADVGLRV